MKKYVTQLFFCIVFVLFLFSTGCTSEASQVDNQNQIIGEYQNKERVKDARDVLVKNLEFAEEEDIEGYLSTISSNAHDETRVAMEDFFENHSVTHSLIEFEVVEEKENEIIAKTQQETKGHSNLKDADYKNHVAEVLHIFRKEQDEWKISESSITNVTFID